MLNNNKQEAHTVSVEAVPTPQLPNDCVASLERLTYLAQTGQLRGFAIAYLLPRGRWETDWCGAAKSRVTFTIGALNILIIQLYNSLRLRDPSETR